MFFSWLHLVLDRAMNADCDLENAFCCPRHSYQHQCKVSKFRGNLRECDFENGIKTPVCTTGAVSKYLGGIP